MVAPSTVFQSPLKCCHCSQSIIHPDISCFQYFVNNLLQNSVAGLKYFSPILITPLVLKYKSVNRELFVNTMKHYLQTVCWGTMASASTFYWVCILRNVIGSFRLYTTLFVPTLLGTQFCWLFPAKVLKLFTTATSQAVLEGLLKQYTNKFTYLILHSPIVQTILFMLNSAIILNFKRKNVYNDFWFIQPYEKVNGCKKEVTEEVNYENVKDINENFKKINTKCGHSHTHVSCFKFVLDGIREYLIYGVPLDLLAMIMRGKIPKNTQGLVPKILAKFKTFRPNMTGFFTSYVGIYRLSSCLLGKYYSHLSLDLQHFLSAFLGGFSYLCVSKVSFLTLSLVTSVKLLWQEFCNSIKPSKPNEKPNLALLLVKNAPLSQIIFSLNAAYLVHNYILNHHLVNNLAKGFIDGLSCNETKNIRNFLLSHDLQTLLDMANTRSIKTFL